MADRAILFDIDGTLVHADHAGWRSMERAIEEVLGVTGLIDGIGIVGRTDAWILDTALRRAGLDPALKAAVFTAYPRHLAATLAAAGTVYRILPGVRDMLDALTGDSRWRVGLLTGNVREGARLKLDHGGLWGSFAFGRFGEESMDRNALAALALADTGLAPDRVLVIGDSVHDVACARANGMPCCAVCTGWTAREELAVAGPDLMVDDLSGWREILARFPCMS